MSRDATLVLPTRSSLILTSRGVLPAAEPRAVVIAGDWHGNTDYAVRVIEAAGRRLRREHAEDQPLILHLGDFGIWPGQAGAGYVYEIEQACKHYGVKLWFIDGNHEDFTQLGSFRSGALVRWLPRGTRWAWHGRRWLALGGAVSLDRAVRTEGRDWWPEEEITEGQAAAVIAGGPADVMLTHECPSGVTHTFPAPPSFWDLRDIARSDRHRERLQGIVNRVQPGRLVHGHLHRAYQRTCDFGYGDVEVTGLDCDGGPNWAVLNVRQMTWSGPYV